MQFDLPCKNGEHPVCLVRSMSFRGIYIIISVILSVYIGWKWGVCLSDASKTISHIIQVFSILAGVLVAVISIIGDPSMLLPGNWRVSFESAKDNQVKIARFAHLFTIYLLAILFALISIFWIEAQMPLYPPLFQLLLGFSVLAILLSLSLPYSLMAIQRNRMQSETDARRH